MEQEKILILNLLDELSDELNEALRSDNIELVSSVEELENRTPTYLLVDSNSKIPETELIKDSRYICFDPKDEIKSFLKEKGDAIFNPALAKTDIGAMLLQRFLSGGSAIQLESAFAGILKKSFSTKFSTPLNIGYFSDIIAKFAHAEKADIVGLRTFLSSVSSFFTYLTKEKISWYPLDVDYGMTEDAMVIQIVAPVTKVYKDYVIQSLAGENLQDPFVGLLDICTKQAHAIDLNYFEKANKLVISGIWLKDQNLLKSNYFSSLLINQIYTFKEQKGNRLNTLTSKVRLADEDIEVNFEHIPGEGIDKFEEEDFEDRKNLVSINKLVEFIKDLRKDESDPRPDGDLALRDISRYLRKYPDQDQIRKLEQNDKEIILKCFKKEGVQEEIDETLTALKSGIDKEDFLQTVLDSITEMDEDEAINVVGGVVSDEEIVNVAGESIEEESVRKVKGLQEEDEHKQTISGGQFEEDESARKVKGQQEEDEHKQVISGGTEEKDDAKIVIKSSIAEKPGVMTLKRLDSVEGPEKSKNYSFKSVKEANPEGWEDKKKNINEKITKKIEEIKERGDDSDLNSLEQEIMTVFKSELGEEPSTEALVQKITSSASDKLVNQKLVSIQEAKLKIEKEKSEQAISLRDEQLVRMKKVLDTIKIENLKLKSQIGQSIQSDYSGDEPFDIEDHSNSKDLTMAQNELRNLQKAMELKEAALEKLKESQKIALENKEKQLNQIQQRLDAVLDSQNKGDQASLAAEMKKVSNENRLLHSQLELKEKTVENMNKRMEDSLESNNNRTSIELERVKEQNRMALEAMKAFKAEKVQLEAKLRVAERDARQKETELNIEKAKASTQPLESSKELREKERELLAQKTENNKLQEQNKTYAIRAKQLEQKMRFLNAQVEGANNKSNKAGRSGSGAAQGAGGAREAKLALKLKQVETAREKMAMDTQRLSTQLDTKKKEALALTTEINTLKNKMIELEQKLSKFEKNAA